jgi:hypothetical protein
VLLVGDETSNHDYKRNPKDGGSHHPVQNGATHKLVFESLSEHGPHSAHRVGKHQRANDFERRVHCDAGNLGGFILAQTHRGHWNGYTYRVPKVLIDTIVDFLSGVILDLKRVR